MQALRRVLASVRLWGARMPGCDFCETCQFCSGVHCANRNMVNRVLVVDIESRVHGGFSKSRRSIHSIGCPSTALDEGLLSFLHCETLSLA